MQRCLPCCHSTWPVHLSLSVVGFRVPHEPLPQPCPVGCTEAVRHAAWEGCPSESDMEASWRDHPSLMLLRSVLQLNVLCECCQSLRVNTHGGFGVRQQWVRQRHVFPTPLSAASAELASLIRGCADTAASASAAACYTNHSTMCIDTASILLDSLSDDNHHLACRFLGRLVGTRGLPCWLGTVGSCLRTWCAVVVSLFKTKCEVRC